MKTIFQLITENPYIELVVLPFLYESSQNRELFIEDNEYIIDNIRDKIKNDGSITRLIRVFPIRS